MSLKVLLVGGTGFIGSRLTQELVRKNHQIVLLTRSPERARKKLFSFPSSHCEFVQWDGTKGLIPSHSIQGVDIVFNMAGEGIADQPWSTKRKRELEASRIQTTQNLVRSLDRVESLKVFCSFSAVGFYGDQGDDLLTEESSKGEGFLSDLCEKWEKSAQSIFEEHPQVRLIQPRLGVVLAKNEGFLKRVEPLFRWGLGGRLGSGKQYMSWVHIDDLISFLVTAMISPNINGTYNLVAPESVTNKAFTKQLARKLDSKAFLNIPSFLIKTVFGEMSEVFLDSQRCKSSRIPSNEFKYQTLNKALDALY